MIDPRPDRHLGQASRESNVFEDIKIGLVGRNL